MHVRGVAREKHPAVPVFGHLALVAVEPRQPADLAHAEIASHRAGEHIDHLGGRGRLGVGHLMMAIPHHRAVPRAVVVASVVRCEKSDHIARAAEGELATRRPVGQLHVGQHHRRQDRLAGELRADEIPHGAVRAVCADHVFRAPRLAVSRIVVVLRPRRDRHAIGILFECNDFETPADVRALVGGVSRERPVDVGLRCDRDELIRRTQMRQIDSRAGEDGDARSAVRVRENVVGQPAGIQHFEGPRHRGERAAGRVHLGPAFEDRHRTAAPGQVACRGQSCRSGTDDEDVHAVGVGHDHTAGVASAGLGYQRRMSSGVEVAE